ncbi:AAA family ATPase [Pseudomonas sp. LjRoot71]|uniref:AAA family ATPase n=1 Tax=Pseudomonas sp. LjRoot71 TaxID=3342336 RepID=UPI003ECE01E9
MSVLSGVIQVTSVKLGSFGGAIFSGRIIGEHRIYTCKVNYKLITRAPQPGECWQLEGSIVGHDQFTNFVQVNRCHIVNLPVAAYLERLLVKHPTFRGLSFGKAKVRKLLREFSAENLVQILNAGKVTHLAEVINPNLAKSIVNAWLTLKNEVATVEFLMRHDFPPDLAKSIIKVCKTNTVERLQQNPYSLIAFHGLHENLWRTIESAALRLGIARDDPRRLSGIVEHFLLSRLDHGHTACPIDDVRSGISAYLQTNDLTEKAITCALERRAICVKKLNGTTLLQPLGAAIIESQVEQRFRELVATPHTLLHRSNSQVAEAIQSYCKLHSELHGYSLAEKQKQAIGMALTNRVSTLTGFAGTGKTTVLKAIVDITSSYRTVYVLALSGKAKERAREATGQEAYTIHSFLAQVNDEHSKISTGGDPLVIVDEASMVDVALMLKLLKAFRNNAFSLLLVGDSGQLSPVGFGICFHILAKSSLIPSTQLNQVHRTTADSLLQQVAMKVRIGTLPELPIWNMEKDGVYLVPCTNKSDLLRELTKIKRFLPDSQILTPHMSERMPDSAHLINNSLQADRQNAFETPGIWMGKYWLRVGDPVIITQNSYEHNLFNGNTGLMTDLVNTDDQSSGVFSFNGEIYTLSRADLFLLGVKLAYAISIHKSQGSEYQTSIICSLTNSDFVERSMFYTGLTRAKRLVLILSTQEICERSVARPNRSDMLCVGFAL